MTILEQKLQRLPTQSGVYIYRDKMDNILYVGKAKVLRNRIKQYFMAGDKTNKVKALVRHIYDLDVIVTPSEGDAFSLENTLIKKYKPPYNILLKDDKQYGYIKVDVNSKYPRVLFTRKLENDGYKYFGPYTGGGSMLIEIINTCFHTAKCKYDFDKLPKGFRPCLNYYIDNCPAPCVNKTSEVEYRAIINDILSLLSGNTQQANEILTAKMQDYAEKMLYEQAKDMRDYINLLRHFCEKKVVVINKSVDYDVFAVCSNGYNTVCNNITVRQGNVVLSDNFVINDGGLDLSQTLASFLMSHYQNTIPTSQVLLNMPISDQELLAELMYKQYGVKVEFICPKQGDKKRIVDMSTANALEYLDKSQDNIDKQYNMTLGAVSQLHEMLHLNNIPRRIECYDISNISGVDKVASMVVFTNGVADKTQYRRFKIKTVEGADDFACMAEVISRRVAHIDKDDDFGTRPDLIVVDGGLGQLGYADKVFNDNNIRNIDLVSLAKREEIVYTMENRNGYQLPMHSYALSLLINVRDEAHRFAITYFRQLHGKNSLKSVLDNIDGVGKKRQVELVRRFNNIENITNASVEDIMQVDGIPRKVAENIYRYFNS
ncbi:MAG: excinuclease ABC subunit UvrC [Clostridia bacterium]|nr:excinuclease ABC subunit UvrC [Clostridia bacterium]